MRNSTSIGIVLLAFLSLISCQNTNSESTDIPQIAIPADLKLGAGCNWKTEKLSVLNSDISFVTFRHQLCGDEIHSPVVVLKNGTEIQKMSFDVVTDGFHIFERTDASMESFIKTLPQDIFKVGENCHPRKVSEKYWIIDDGLAPDAEINSIPCGKYGRNFSGQTVFEIRDDVILNYGTYSVGYGIDKTSIKFEKFSP